MDFTLLNPSLQHFCTARLAVELWTSDHVRNDLIQFITVKKDQKVASLRLVRPNCFETMALESKILDLISAKVEELRLPRILKDEVRKVLKPIANEIYKGYVGLFNEKVRTNFDYYFNHLQWTPWGQVDRQKTVQSLMDNHNFDIELRYFWSCTYMCGYYNSKYWYECKEEMKEHIESRVELSGCEYNFQFVDCWKCRRDQLEELIEFLNVKVPISYPQRCVTEMVIDGKYEMTFQQFWLSSSPEKKFDIVDKFAREKFNIYHSICCWEVLFFLMTQMTTEQQTIFFRNNALCIGTLFLENWTRREMFLPTVKRMWNHFDRFNLLQLLRRVAGLGSCGFRDVDQSRQLFYQVWVHDLNVVEENVYHWCHVLSDVFATSMDAKSVKFLLEAVSPVPVGKEVIVNSLGRAISTLPFYATDEHLNLLDAFLREIALNENDLNKLKTEILYFACDEIFITLIREGKLGSADRILNWALSSQGKRVEFKNWLFFYTSAVTICREWLAQNNLTAIDHLTNWWFTSEVDKINFKNRVFSGEI